MSAVVDRADSDLMSEIWAGRYQMQEPCGCSGGTGTTLLALSRWGFDLGLRSKNHAGRQPMALGAPNSN